MKIFRIAFLFMAFTMPLVRVFGQAPAGLYEKEWKAVDQLIAKRLPASALTEVQKIYTAAKKNNHEAQVIKSLIFISQIREELTDEDGSVAIKEIEKELKTSKEPAKSILNSIVAGYYWQYYNRHRWEMYNRTQTAGFKKEDIATWGPEEFHARITDHYLASLQERSLLQKTRLEPYDAIIYKGNMRHLRPTLFDLLAHRALEYFENDERDLNKPAYVFEIDQAAAFDPAEDFVNRKFETRDSLSLQQKALTIYQQIIGFHLRDQKPDALIDADLQRLQFVRTKSVHPEKDKLYFNALNHIAHQYESTPAAAQAWYLVAAYHNEKASGYKPYQDSTYRLDKVKAVAICEKVLAQKDSSEGKTNCYNLLQSIRTKTAGFEMEKVNLPSRPFRVLVQYQNIPGVYFRLLRVDEKLKKDLINQYDAKFWPAILATNPIRSWNQALPGTSDYQRHQAEIKVDALPLGEYLLVISTDKDFKGSSASIGARWFYVSGISYGSYNNDIFVLDRDNGQPLSGASVTVWRQRYDYTTSRYVNQASGTYKTDANGLARIPERKPANNNEDRLPYRFELTHKTDKLFIQEPVYDTYYRYGQPAQEPTRQVFLFLDRSLYRPGQVVYFKGIAISTDHQQKNSSAMVKRENTIYLVDANGQNIDSQKVVTNEFGSFNGKFQLPQSGLTGNFSLTTVRDAGNASFNVEEYKRPKFYVDFDPLKNTFRVNDSITVVGFAKAYAGNNISGATVKYRVTRQPRFIYPWMFDRWWFPPVSPMEIAHGETTTDQDGKFSVRFKAIPDLTVDKKFDPVFDYSISAEITDLNGETRTGEKSVSVSYKALILTSNIPGSIAVDSLKTLFVRTENMAGEFQPVTLRITITKLKQDDRLIRNRFWERPDQFIYSKEEYVRDFPNDEYDNETDWKNWPKTNLGFTVTDSSRQSGNLPIADHWKDKDPGFYVIEIVTRDSDGQEVKGLHYLELFDSRSNSLLKPAYLWASGTNVAEPGGKATTTIGTSANNVFLIQHVEKGSQDRTVLPGSYSFFRINNEKKQFDFPVSEADRGGYQVHWIFVKNNRFYLYTQGITVPWSNKDLQIEYASYRDKTLPGSEEKWTLKIKGYKNESVAAELLASMYDASLDQFYAHNWHKPSVWPINYFYTNWNSASNFSKIESQLKQGETTQDYKPLVKNYDRLDDDIYSVSQDFAKRLVGRAAGIQAQAPAPALESRRELAASNVASKDDGLLDASDTVSFSFKSEEGSGFPAAPGKPDQGSEVQVRKNFNETAFFFPDLRTDSSGAIEFSFTLPEALTKWKFQALAHTKDLSFGYSTKDIITQKQLMVQPNAPRFLREGDRIEFSSKIVNLSEKELTGQAGLQLFDAATNQPVDAIFKHNLKSVPFSVAAGQSLAVKFVLEVPQRFNSALTWKMVASTGDANFSDGEENMMPVVTNRMLVTESLPLAIRGSGSKTYNFEKLSQSTSSNSIQHASLTVEYTSNPAWYAIQALPYLMEYPYDCAEQSWNRYYAYSVAGLVVNSSPRIKHIFEKWKRSDTSALLSNLEKNPELKSVLLEETPWVLAAKTESQQKKNMALLFDLVKMNQELNGAYEKLKQMQSENGGFVWFKNGPDDRYITQYIVTGIGHLNKIKAVNAMQKGNLDAILASAIPYLDRKIKEDYDRLVRSKTNLKSYSPGYVEIQYLYMRSFFPEYKVPAVSLTAYNYFKSRLPLSWTQQNKYMQGMIALVLGRAGDIKTSTDILKSLKETAIKNEELGMYWKDNRRGWWWYEAPIERQALLIEAFQEIGKDLNTVNDLRTWLLKNKQTNRWESTKATAEACYALLLQGTQWLSSEPAVTIQAGNAVFHSNAEPSEAGTGYFKKVVPGNEVTASMGTISLQVSQPAGTTQQPSWGGIYWQYFEDLDKITPAATPLNLVKKLFVQTNSDRGPVLTPVTSEYVLKTGDRIVVRIELRVDREMEYVHMKDMRASCLEPVNVLSGYRWQNGMGYYEATRDLSTNFFFDRLQKGTYVFEYPLFVTHTGNFSNGVTSIQCMYAPEFSAHSEGIRLRVN
jgi:uncharacterized protein YfaS (alpha-2-macroglobulin family)